MLYEALHEAVRRPTPFSVHTTRELWTDPHVSSQMLAFHLDGDVDVSSRRTAFLDASVRWMIERFQLSAGKRVIDFGCGPGHYVSRFARSGADVTGVDFSSRSIAYAREQAKREGLAVHLHEADYLSYEPERQFDLITMIMCDFCALGPDHRARLLATFRSALADGGHVIFDVYSLAAFRLVEETVRFEENMMNGFWSSERYFAFLARFRYDAERVSLDRYTIVEPDRRWTICNWLQYFSVDQLEAELRAAGLALETVLGSVAGDAYDAEGPELAIVARKA